MKDLAKFGTEEHPIHPSGIRMLLLCPWRSVVKFLVEGEEASGPAADTGSAVHVAVYEFHRGKGAADALGGMSARAQDYPQADLREAAELFLKYAADPRNRDAEVVLCEEPIAFSISPAPEDPTQAPIQVIGTLDQVRMVDGQPKLYDVKTSKRDPILLTHLYAYQMAAYCVGASIKLNRTVEPGAIICPRRYGADPGRSPAFFHFAWSFSDIPQMLSGLRHTVAAIRAGHVWHVPNEDCNYCMLRTPDVCLPQLQKTLKLLEKPA